MNKVLNSKFLFQPMREFTTKLTSTDINGRSSWIMYDGHAWFVMAAALEVRQLIRIICFCFCVNISLSKSFTIINLACFHHFGKWLWPHQISVNNNSFLTTQCMYELKGTMSYSKLVSNRKRYANWYRSEIRSTKSEIEQHVICKQNCTYGSVY